jgi:hypothetical protein
MIPSQRQPQRTRRWKPAARRKHFILQSRDATKLTDDDIPRVLAFRVSLVFDPRPRDQDVLPASVAPSDKL